VSMLDRKLWRDFVRMRGQTLSIALVLACGIAVLVASIATWQSLIASRAAFYDEARFASIFASAKRVPQSAAARIDAIPGIGLAETRVAEDVTITADGENEPLTAHIISLPESGDPA
jgi:putative ABC transport system permease protein